MMASGRASGVGFIVFLISALAGCGSTVEPAGAGGGGAEGGGGPGGGGGAGGGAAGAPCGGFTGARCADDAYCDYPDDSCGAGDRTGVCKPRPTVCSDGDLACGCDGKVRYRGCEALEGVDVAPADRCELPEDVFACGDKICERAGFYCHRDVSDVGSIPDSWGCRRLPAACGDAPDCACLADEVCGSSCEVASDGSITVTCPGG